MAIKLTKAAISNVQSVAERTGKAQILRDEDTPGLYVRAAPTGKATFYMRYRIGRGANAPIREAWLGELSLTFPIDAARRRGLQLKSAGQQGRDLLNESKVMEHAATAAKTRQEDLLVSPLLDQWVQFLRDRDRRWAEGERIVDKELKPAWGARQLDELTYPDVLALVQMVTERTRKSGRKNATGAQGHKVLQTARRFFSWARKQRIIKENPAADLEAPVVEKRRQRLLNDDEIRAFWTSTGLMGYPFGACLRLLLLTGQRLRIASEAERGELQHPDETRGLWRIPSNRTKNGKIHLLPVGRIASQILIEAAKASPADKFLFSTGSTPISGWSKKKTELDRLMLVQLQAAVDRGADPRSVELQPWVFHDLRRTLSTVVVDRCGVLPEIASLIRHNLPRNADETDVIYMLSRREREMREALASWETEVMRIVETE